MHVLFTAHRFHPSVGGTEQAVMGLARAVRAHGHEVTIATSAEPGAPAAENVQGLHVRRFELRRLGKFRFPPAEYARFVKEGPWDVIHVHGQRVWSSDYLFRHVPRAKAPAVMTAHGFYQYHMHPRNLVERWYYHRHLPRAMRAFARVIALTSGEREEWARFGVPREKLTVIPNGIDLSEFASRPPAGFREKYGIKRRHLLLYAGGYYDNKRVSFLVEAAARLESDAELVVLGRDPTDGRAQRDAEALARRLGAPVRALGVLPREDVLRAFWESDLFLLASSFEGYGLVLLEAMAAGLPFVATTSGAAPDLAARGVGVIADTPEGMARAADALLADEGARRAMAARGPPLAHAQTWEAVAREHVAEYERAKRA